MTVDGQDIMVDQFGMGAFSMIVVEDMELKDVAALKEKIEQLEKEQQEIRQEIGNGNPELNARLDVLEKQQQELVEI